MTPPTKDPSAEDLEQAMAGSPILARTQRAAVVDLAAQGRVRHFRRGTYLFHQGDESHDLFFLWQGRVDISSLSSTGHRILHTTLDGAQFFGELGVLGELPRTSTAMALEESTVWIVRGPVFLDFLAGHPDATRELLRALAAQIHANESFVEDLLYLDLKGRVAKRLLQLVAPSLDEPPPDGSVVPSVVTHADLASLCGGSRENVTRILSELQRRRLVEREGRRYVLRDVSGLRRLAGL
jgi:CRP/FNR family transcriptional regulator, cyclic AMP receptor protein